MIKDPQRCVMKNCRGEYEQSKTNPDYFICKVCGIGIWRDYKPPDISRKNIIESETGGYYIQRQFGLNTREIKAKCKGKGRKSAGRSRRRKKVYYRPKQEFI
jgi:hypothetical protein